MIAPMHLGDLEQLMFGSIAKLLEQAEPGESGLLRARRAARASGWSRSSASRRSSRPKATPTKTRTAAGGRMIRARPEVAMLSDAMRQAQSLIGELMLNPSAALRIASGHKPQAGAFDDF
jgi:phage terminase small subunit